MSGAGLAQCTNYELNHGAPAKVEFFLSDREGAAELRERSYEVSRRLLNTLSVQFELSRAAHSSSQGEWVTLTGPRENLEKAKDLVLSFLMPRCHSELASDCQPSTATEVSMAHAVYTSHYDALPHSSSSLSSLSSYSRNVSPPPTTYQSYATQHRSEAPYPPSLETRSRVEPTPITSTYDSTEQLRDAIQKLSPEEIKSLLLRNLQPDSSRTAPSHHASGDKSVPVGLLSRSPDQREKKISHFVNKLNYPRDKVELVLNQLGPDASDNDILERLFKVCKPNNTRPPSMSGGMGGGGGFERSPRYSSSGPQVIGEQVMVSGLHVAPPTLTSTAGGYVTQSQSVQDPTRLRHIVIDGSNVAMRHGNGHYFSCRGIQLAVNFFRKRGHDKITVFVPEWRKEASKPETPITDQEILHLLEREDVLKYTPSRRIKGKRVACYDDRFILDLASEMGGVIVSNDQFRDLMDDKPEWREMIETRLLQFQFVDDYFMIPYDPMGKDGPTLDHLLCKDPKDVPAKPKPSHGGASNSRQICPYMEKCTFGRKCKFYHPEREARTDPSACGPQSSTSPVGNRTPNASRSATPSPSPEKWYNRYGGSNRSSGEDLRQMASNNGSTDDLSSSSNYLPANGTVDIAELSHVMQNSLRMHDIPPTAVGQSTVAPGNQSTGGFYDNRTRPVPPPSMGIRSAPVFSSSAASTPSEPLAQPHRHTFPMAILPPSHHVNSRTHVMTEQHHRQMTGPQGGVGGVASAMGIPQLAPEMDPNVMLPLQRRSIPGGYSSSHHPPSGYHPSSLLPPEAPPPSTNPVGPQGAPPHGMFVRGDGWMPSSAAHYPPQGLVGGRGNSLMPAPPGYYPSSQGPPGFNSRGGNPADSGISIPHSHSTMGPSVPSTRTSPYHQYQQQPDIAGHPSQRHSSLDYGNPQNISPQRRTSYSSESQKMNGGFPQASTSASGGYGGSPYYQDHNQPGAAGMMSGSTGFAGRSILGHQSNTSFSQSSSSSHHQPHPSHPHHRLPAVNERLHESRQQLPSFDHVLFRKVSAVFQGCDDLILSIMSTHPHVCNFEELVGLVQQTVTSR